MVEIIPANQRASFSSMLGQQLGSGLGAGFAKGMNDAATLKKKMAILSQENEAAKKMGIDLSGIEDPGMRKAVIAENLKAQSKKDLLGEKQSYLQNLFGSSQSKMQENESSEQNIGFDPSNLTDEQIAAITAVDPNIARNLMHAKDVSIREARAEKEFNQKNIHHGYDINKDYINKITDGAQAADEMDMRLDQMLSLKDLPTPLMATTLETLGLPTSLFSADAETADKLSIDLTKNIQQFYGNRILQSEFQAFLRSIPSLKNTSEGRKRIIRNMKSFNDLKRLEYNKMRQKQIEYEEKGKPMPSSFRNQILDEMRPDAEKIAKEFKESVKYSKPLKRKKVLKGTHITDDLIDKYILDAKGDLEKARKNALEDNYVID